MRRGILLLSASFIILSAFVGPVGAQVVVPATANVFGAGHAVPPAPSGHGGGTLPPMVTLPSGTGRTIQFSATGLVSYCPPCGQFGPDGLASSGVLTIAYGGLAGPAFSTRLRYLAGVFLDDSEPVDPAPASIVYLDGAFTDTSPELNQIFFIGDGLTGEGTGTAQTIHVPDTATRLFYGFIDYWSASGPGGYEDNAGSVSVTASMSPTGVGNAPRLAPRLSAAFPNPFSGATSVTVSSDAEESFRLDVYDVKGRLVRTLAEGNLTGERRLEWDGRTGDGRLASSGVYYLRLVTPSGIETRKIVLAR